MAQPQIYAPMHKFEIEHTCISPRKHERADAHARLGTCEHWSGPRLRLLGPAKPRPLPTDQTRLWPGHFGRSCGTQANGDC
eukprot:3785884-Pleurochrysis_carterae.AAC.3